LGSAAPSAAPPPLDEAQVEADEHQRAAIHSKPRIPEEGLMTFPFDS